VPECPDVKNYKWWRLNPVWHRMLYSRTHTATVGVKRLLITMIIRCIAFSLFSMYFVGVPLNVLTTHSVRTSYWIKRLVTYLLNTNHRKRRATWRHSPGVVNNRCLVEAFAIEQLQRVLYCYTWTQSQRWVEFQFTHWSTPPPYTQSSIPYRLQCSVFSYILHHCYELSITEIIYLI